MTQGLIETGRDQIASTADPYEDAARAEALRAIVEAAVSVVFSIETTQLRSGSRGQAPVALARQVAMYLAHCALGLSHTEIGRLFERDRTTVGHACHIIEDKRDDQVFDRTMSNLEEIVCRLALLRGCRGSFEP